ncbi:MAG: hypothetical protein JW822_08760 [Spirochaetales bacterium]|nr:hypothetical protein [Spirochaetales bacterium]
MKDKIVWFLLGIFICLSFVLLIGAKDLQCWNQPSSAIATSSDGKYVYIIGGRTDQYYRSEDFGKTFQNFDIVK